jgi:hypothetical protein
VGHLVDAVGGDSVADSFLDLLARQVHTRVVEDGMDAFMLDSEPGTHERSFSDFAVDADGALREVVDTFG